MKRVFYHCSSSPFVDLVASWRWVGQNFQTYSLLPKSTDQVGSANINDRSLLGNRDAELGVVTWAGQFPKTLRETLLRCLVGIWGWRCRWRTMAPSLDEPNKIPKLPNISGFPRSFHHRILAQCMFTATNAQDTIWVLLDIQSSALPGGFHTKLWELAIFSLGFEVPK